MSDEKENPLYPELTEQGKEEAQKLMDRFKPKILALVKELMDDLYTDVSYHIESDHWCNYRNDILNGFEGYTQGKVNNEYNFKQLRQSIYKNHKDEIIKDLNNDLIEENEQLKKQAEELRQSIRDNNRHY